MLEFHKNALLFLYISLVVSFVWVVLSRDKDKRILKEGLKTFGAFSLGGIILGIIVYLLS